MNIKGEKGFPWWNPIQGLKLEVGEPFKSIKKKGVEIKDLIHSIHYSKNSNS